MNLKKALWTNWMAWSAGGLPDATVQTELEDNDKNELLAWIQIDIPKLGISRLKHALDIASWCLYGTHTLLYLDAEMRETRLKDAAKNFGIESSTLNQCLERSVSLPAEV